MKIVIHDDYGYTAISLYQDAYSLYKNGLVLPPSGPTFGMSSTTSTTVDAHPGASCSTSTASVPPVPVLQKMFNSDDFALMAKVLERDFDVVDGWAELLRQMPHKRERIEQAFASVCTNRLLGGK